MITFVFDFLNNCSHGSLINKVISFASFFDKLNF